MRACFRRGQQGFIGERSDIKPAEVPVLHSISDSGVPGMLCVPSCRICRVPWENFVYIRPGSNGGFTELLVIGAAGSRVGWDAGEVLEAASVLCSTNVNLHVL
jgi:hypothetical protein